ncbi:MAG TPA: NADH:ubiquinone oxidoreductase [Thermoplasmatales archaeon]|nr:NADH:ubiquinone oxidoreductase [Thermoplasmatales archaeon]
MSKPRVAFFDFASCEGCELQVANLEEEVLDLIEIVDVVSFREVMKEHSDDYDIAFVEGSIMRPMDEERLKKIRGNAKILVAFGACATIGGVNKIRNQWQPDEVLKEVYGDADLEGNEFFDVFKTKAVDEVVKVDYYIYGCPPPREEIKKVITALVMGKKPDIPNYPVCVECKKNENVCLFELGKFCLGPITRAGCNAICPSNGRACDGCRGILSEPDTRCVEDILERYGLTYDELKHRFTIFNYGREEEK